MFSLYRIEWPLPKLYVRWHQKCIDCWKTVMSVIFSIVKKYRGWKYHWNFENQHWVKNQGVNTLRLKKLSGALYIYVSVFLSLTFWMEFVGIYFMSVSLSVKNFSSLSLILNYKRYLQTLHIWHTNPIKRHQGQWPWYLDSDLILKIAILDFVASRGIHDSQTHLNWL